MDDEENHSTQPYGSLIQNFNRWLLSTLSWESIVNGETPNIRQPTMSSLSIENSPSAIDQVLGTRMRTANTCSACQATVTRETVMHVLDVQYPRKANASFCEVLQNSIVRDTDTKATCSSCKRFIKILSKRSLAGEQGEALPPVLSINANAATAEVESLWKTGYLPTRFVVSDQDGVTFAMEGSGMAYNLKVSGPRVRS
jgi:PAB-dependent poly(A)-specific ribonuclease subunit 2